MKPLHQSLQNKAQFGIVHWGGGVRAVGKEMVHEQLLVDRVKARTLRRVGHVWKDGENKEPLVRIRGKSHVSYKTCEFIA